MEICVGMMFMSPADFWQMSPVEMYAAVAGFTEFHTAPKDDPMSRDELDSLMELYPD